VVESTEGSYGSVIHFAVMRPDEIGAKGLDSSRAIYPDEILESSRFHRDFFGMARSKGLRMTGGRWQTHFA
jgi:hypothetical protein